MDVDDAAGADAPPPSAAVSVSAASAASSSDPPPFTDAELLTALKVVAALGKDPALYRSKPLRGLRVALAPLVQAAQAQMFEGSSAASYREERSAKRSASARRTLEKRRDAEYLQKTALRASRVAKLSVLGQQAGVGEDGGPSVPLIPDGVAEDSAAFIAALRAGGGAL